MQEAEHNKRSAGDFYHTESSAMNMNGSDSTLVHIYVYACHDHAR